MKKTLPISKILFKFSASSCFIGALSAAFLGCSSRPVADSETQTKALQDEVDRQRTSLIVLSANVKTLFEKYKKAEFNAAIASGYQRIDSKTGVFLVLCDSVQPYLDGQKVRLKIGNVNSATYSGFTLHAEWGTKVPQLTEFRSGDEWDKFFGAWEQSLRKIDIDSTLDLKPGSWNSVDIVLSPAKADELGYIGLSITTNSVILTADRP
jgi:hypothetical protein